MNGGLEQCPSRDLTPPQIRREVHPRVVVIDKPGDANTNSDDLFGAAFDEFGDRLGDDVQYRISVNARSGSASSADDGAVLIDESSEDLGTPDIDSDAVRHGCKASSPATPLTPTRRRRGSTPRGPPSARAIRPP